MIRLSFKLIIVNLYINEKNEKGQCAWKVEKRKIRVKLRSQRELANNKTISHNFMRYPFYLKS